MRHRTDAHRAPGTGQQATFCSGDHDDLRLTVVDRRGIAVAVVGSG